MVWGAGCEMGSTCCQVILWDKEKETCNQGQCAATMSG